MVSWKIVKPRLVQITFVGKRPRSHVFTRCFLSASVVEFNFSPNIVQIGYTSPIGTFRFYKCNRFQKFF